MNNWLDRSIDTRKAVTLIELLVSTTIVVMIMALLLATVEQAQLISQRTTAKVSQFQRSRAAFDAMTRRLSQATLNTYWMAFDASQTDATDDFSFRRSSELQFISGSAGGTTLDGMPGIFTVAPRLPDLSPQPEFSYPTHAIFFYAPIGYSEEHESDGNPSTPLKFRELDNLLSACGYFIEFGDDPQRPQTLSSLPSRHRSRLMELTVPAERLTIYQRRENTNAEKQSIAPQVLDETWQDYSPLVGGNRRHSGNWVRPFWMKEALRRSPASPGGPPRFAYAHPLAENVVALVILPKLAVKDRAQPERLDELSPDFEYDSWRVLKSDAKLGLANAARDNLLPPILQVVVAAIDEPSAERCQFTGDNPPRWTRDLFHKAGSENDLRADLTKLEAALSSDPHRINYRIFTTDVLIRGCKWSKDPIEPDIMNLPQH